jgi:hypothetical protein
MRPVPTPKSTANPPVGLLSPRPPSQIATVSAVAASSRVPRDRSGIIPSIDDPPATAVPSGLDATAARPLGRTARRLSSRRRPPALVARDRRDARSGVTPKVPWRAGAGPAAATVGRRAIVTNARDGGADRLGTRTGTRPRGRAWVTARPGPSRPAPGVDTPLLTRRPPSRRPPSPAGGV